MGLFDRLDRLDDRVFRRPPRPEQEQNANHVAAEVACRIGAFLRRHSVLFGLLLSADLVVVGFDAMSVATATATGQIVRRGSRVVVGIASAAMIVLLRARRPRYSLYAAAAGIGAIAVEGVVLFVLGRELIVGALGTLMCLVFTWFLFAVRAVPQHCSEGPSNGTGRA